MSKCVTSEHCCEISNLIHEEVVVVVERWSGDGLLQAAFRKNPWLFKKLSLAAKRETAPTYRANMDGMFLGDFKNKQKDKRKLMCRLVNTIFRWVYA